MKPQILSGLPLAASISGARAQEQNAQSADQIAIIKIRVSPVLTVACDTVQEADNATADGPKENRRVEIIVSGEAIGTRIG